jgi:ESCRT-I complex subunit VPS28
VIFALTLTLSASMEARRPTAQARASVDSASATEASVHERAAALTADIPLPPLPTPEVVAPTQPVVEVAPAAVSEAPSVTEAKSDPAPAAQLAPRPMINMTPGERKEANMQAELYALFVTMEHLEGAFVKGLVSNEVYQKQCNQMNSQFKVLKTALQTQIPKMEDWYNEYELECPLAKERFLKGVSAIDEYGGSETKDKAGLVGGVQQATELFITLTNAFELDYRSCAQLLPLVKDLQTAIGVLPQLQGVEKITQWLVTLNNMRASDELSEDQFAQLKLDTEIAYSALRNYAQTQW